MPEYGQQARTATQDANEGVVNPPSQRTSVRQTTARQVGNSTLSEGVASIGASLGGALQEFKNASDNEIRRNKALEASIRQGQETAINQIDADKKRTGWEKFVFGQSIGYRAAQQRAVLNNVQQAYLEESVAVDSYANLDKEEYAKRTSESLSKMLEAHKGDAETQALITETWTKAAEKLTTQHTKAHYAYEQTEQRATTANKIRGSFDGFTNDYRAATDDAERAKVISTAVNFFKNPKPPQGMFPKAYRSLVNEELNNSLKSGNIGTYKIAIAAGWVGKLNPAERVQLDAAIAKYDQHHSQQVERVFSEGYNAILDISASTPEETTLQVNAALTALIGQVQGLQQTSSDSDSARNKLADTETRIKRIRDAGIKSAAKNMLKMQETNNIKEKLSSGDMAVRATLSQYKPEDIKKAGDSVIYDMISKAAGEQLSPDDAIKWMLTQPDGIQTMKDVTRLAKTWEHNSPLLENVIHTMTEGWENMYDESGVVVPERSEQYLARIDILGADDTLITKMGRSKSAGKYRIIRNAIGMKQTRNQIDQRLKDYDEYFNKSGAIGSNVPNKEIDGYKWDKQDFVADAVAEVSGNKPEGISLSKYMIDYQDGLVINGYNHHAAIKYVQDVVKYNDARFGNTIIPHASELKEMLGEYSLDDVMSWADKGDATRAGDKTPVDNIVSRLTGELGSLYNIKNLKAELIAGSDQIVLSYTGGNPVAVSFAWIKQQRDDMIAWRKKEAKTKAALAEAELQRGLLIQEDADRMSRGMR